jgi:hypothetical protein
VTIGELRTEHPVVYTQRSLIWNSTSTNVELFRYLSSIQNLWSKERQSSAHFDPYPAPATAMAEHVTCVFAVFLWAFA